MSGFSPLATKGDARAQYYLGYLYESGELGRRDPQIAFGWYKKAALQDYLPAVVYMGYAYASGRGVLRDEKQAFEWYTRAAQLGDAGAQNNLGVMLRAGRPYRQDLGLAAQWFLQAATQGNVRAQYNLASMYAAGQGIKKNIPEALRWYELAAEGGDMYAQAALADIYRTGNNVEKNEARAADLYRQAAEQGYAPAQYALGLFLERGIGGAPAEALSWYTKASDQNLSLARRRLASLFDEGKITPRNEAEAKRLYKISIDKDKDPAAMLALGRLLERGRKPDGRTARDLYLRAAQAGYGPAQMELARSYRDGGPDVERDFLEAYYWFSTAGSALQGEEKIAAGKARAQVAAMLSPEQLEEARSRVGQGFARSEPPAARAKKKGPPPFEYR